MDVSCIVSIYNCSRISRRSFFVNAIIMIGATSIELEFGNLEFDQVFQTRVLYQIVIFLLYRAHRPAA